MLYFTWVGNWEENALFKKKGKKKPTKTTHWLPRTQTLQEVRECKISTQKHIPLVGEMNIEFQTDVPLTCPALLHASLVSPGAALMQILAHTIWKEVFYAFTEIIISSVYRVHHLI